MEQLIILLVALGLATLVGQIGKNRKIGFGWSFALSFFLSPIIGVIIMNLLKKQEYKLSYIALG